MPGYINDNLPGSCPEIFSASSQTKLWTPNSGVMWNFTKKRSPWALTRVYVFTPNPCIMRYERGMAIFPSSCGKQWRRRFERTAIRHDPHNHMCGCRVRFREGQCIKCSMLTLGLQTDKVPEIVMSSLALRYFVMWLRLDGMNKVREFDSILNEKHRNVVGNYIPIALGSKEFHGETTNIPYSVQCHV